MCLSCHGYSNSVRGIFYNHRNQPNFSHLPNNNKNLKKKKPKVQKLKLTALKFMKLLQIAHTIKIEYWRCEAQCWDSELTDLVYIENSKTLIRNPSRPVLDWAWTLRLHSFWAQREWVSFSLITAGLDWN